MVVEAGGCPSGEESLGMPRRLAGHRAFRRRLGSDIDVEGGAALLIRKRKSNSSSTVLNGERLVETLRNPERSVGGSGMEAGVASSRDCR
jgi:hypothetical protein